jgi:hypothetical protein
VARERFGWEPGLENFVGARLIHVAETNAKAIEEAKEAMAYFFRVFSRPVNNPAPVPGLHTDRSFQHRHRIERDFPGPHTPFEQMRNDGFIVCGDPDYVTRWLENDMKIAGYGHFLGMFHAGNLPHEKVMASKRLFATHVMPALRPLNADQSEPQTAAASASAYRLRETDAADNLPLYRDFNYVLTRDALETLREFVESENGKVTAGWEMRVPEREPDGFPYQIIFVGPTGEHRGSAIRLRLTSRDGDEISDDAEVLVETSHETGAARQVIFQGKYQQFREIPDQAAPDAAVAVQQRVVAQDRYVIRLAVTTSAGTPPPDPTADASFFELECFKHVLNVTA